MTDYQIDRLIAWLYIIFSGLGIMTIVVIITLLTSFVIYIKTGVHFKDWLEEKFPRD